MVELGFKPGQSPEETALSRPRVRAEQSPGLAGVCPEGLVSSFPSWCGSLLLATDVFQLSERTTNIMSLWKWGFGWKAAQTFVFRRCSALCFAALGLKLPHWPPRPLAPFQYSLCPLSPSPGLTRTAAVRPGLQLQLEGFWLDARKYSPTAGSCERVRLEVGRSPEPAVQTVMGVCEGRWTRPSDLVPGDGSDLGPPLPIPHPCTGLGTSPTRPPPPL